ncbi:type II toxin-antitoxin system RelE/ParE family toxin [Winogradskyella forsetii]|uniref:type II toxin-antitoxin system RelE/ParE family toxin n=1 Tax=Winogradskyella forsetii TaxID=2686077 RepID=UPI0015BC2042|nr:type II toxin-antitoxin system RelE/ParE family toxin [Winogradskyella forsetii]
MAQRNVIWTRTADIQFVGLLEYWVNRNKSATFSKKLVGFVTKHTKEIAKTPFIYKTADFKDIRVSSLGNFSIYFKPTETSIIIYAFWDNRQNPKTLLDIMKTNM